MAENQTPLQRRIENLVTDGIGFARIRDSLPERILNSDDLIPTVLWQMDVRRFEQLIPNSNYPLTVDLRLGPREPYLLDSPSYSPAIRY